MVTGGGVPWMQMHFCGSEYKGGMVKGGHHTLRSNPGVDGFTQGCWNTLLYMYKHICSRIPNLETMMSAEVFFKSFVLSDHLHNENLENILPTCSQAHVSKISPLSLTPFKSTKTALIGNWCPDSRQTFSANPEQKTFGCAWIATSKQLRSLLNGSVCACSEITYTKSLLVHPPPMKFSRLNSAKMRPVSSPLPAQKSQRRRPPR